MGRMRGEGHRAYFLALQTPAASLADVGRTGTGFRADVTRGKGGEGGGKLIARGEEAMLFSEAAD